MNNSITKLTLDESKPIWDKILSGTNLPLPIFSYEWYKSWVDVKQEWQPYILLINNTTIAPFVRKNDLVQFTHIYTDFNDLIGPIEEVWPLVLNFLKQDGIKRMEIEQIPENSETVKFFTTYFQTHTNGDISSPKTAPFITLPSSFEEYIFQPGIKEKRRKYNKFQKDFPNTLLIKTDTPAEYLDIMFDLMLTDPVKQASLDETKKLFWKKIANTCNNLWVHLLTSNSKIIAYLFAFSSQNKAMLYVSGYNKDKYDNIGTYVIFATIKQAIEDGYKEFSLLKGREPYKYEMGAKDFLLYRINLDL